MTEEWMRRINSSNLSIEFQIFAVEHICMRYDLNLLPVFMALMQERSVTRAAARLNITQPALSNALTRLRALMLDPLFIRERYGMQPTAKAQELAPVIAPALEALDGVILGQLIECRNQVLGPDPIERRPTRHVMAHLLVPLLGDMQCVGQVVPRLFGLDEREQGSDGVSDITDEG